MLRYGMVGGGPGAFIGDVHRKAMGLDARCAIVAGSFSRVDQKCIEMGEQLGLDKSRVYSDYREMARKEAAREDGIDFVVIVTPNALHYPIVKTFMENGINVVCEKPLSVEAREAEELVALADAKDLLFMVTYGYSGYPMVKHAREMVRNGDIGEIRTVAAEYPQEWLADDTQDNDGTKLLWRLDPAQQGRSSCVADIGSHIENTVAYMTGLEIVSLCANLDIFGRDRKLDTNAGILIKYSNGSSGMYWCSQIAIGNNNGLKVRVFGTKGAVEWYQETPDVIKVTMLGQPVQTLAKGRDKLYPHAMRYCRTPGGHPEGLHEAFANLYRTFCDALQKKKSGYRLEEEDLDFPSGRQGLSGMRFIDKCVESARNNSAWVEL